MRILQKYACLKQYANNIVLFTLNRCKNKLSSAISQKCKGRYAKSNSPIS